MKNRVLDGIMGLCVVDALGVPVEFNSRGRLKANRYCEICVWSRAITMRGCR